MTDEQATGLIGLGQKVIGALPAQFLALLVINVALVGGLLWHLDSVAVQRERVLTLLVNNCLNDHAKTP
jgi:hypothetical protein